MTEAANTSSEAVASRDELAAALLELIRDRVLELAPDFGPGDNLYDAGLDSMAIMQLLLVVEEEFGVPIPVESASKKNLSSALALADLVLSKTGATAKSTPAPATPSPDIQKSTAEPTRSAEPAGADTGGFERLFMRGADYFVMSFDRLSRKTGQGGHKAHSFLLLDRLPDITRLRDALQRATERHPMLNARLRRNWLPGIPSWVPSRRPIAPEVASYSEKGSAGRLLPGGAREFDDAHALMEQITNSPMPEMKGPAWPKARFSILEMTDGTAILVFSWSHLMMDGVGAELFLQELDNIASGEKQPPIPPLNPASANRVSDAAGAWQRAHPMVDFFRKLARTPITCLGPDKPCPGRTHFLVHTLTAAETDAVRSRCAALCGDLVSMPFYLAAAMRAHGVIFARRGCIPPSQTCAVPIQTRRKGSPGPIFLNHITMFFGVLTHEDQVSIESATASLLEQHARFLKDRMGESLNDLMHLMSYIPPGLYMTFMKMQMRGPFSSLFHSHTGEFAAGLDSFLGAGITGAFHVPGIGTPPGTGIFCNEKNGRLVVTMCWHEDSLDEAERKILLESFLSDLGVS